MGFLSRYFIQASSSASSASLLPCLFCAVAQLVALFAGPGELTMISLGTQRSNWAYASIPRDPEPPAGQTLKLGLRYRLFPKKAPFLEKEQEAASLRSCRSTEDPSPAEVTLGNGSRRQRPRHVPIIISQSVIQSVLRDLPDSPVSPAWSGQVNFISALESTKGPAGCSLDSIYRPRHIPIVIPSFAQPHNLSLASPSGRYHHTPELSPASPYSCKRFYFAMSRPTTSGSRTNTLDATVSAPSPTQTYGRSFKPSSGPYSAGQNGSQTSLNQSMHDGRENLDLASKSARVGEPRPRSATTSPATGQQSQMVNGTTHLSGLVCNVHRCTGKQPHALVGATTTILGDKLYVFGGRVLSRRRPPLTSDLYELDLIRRHWTRLETYGDIPPPRYFHSVCALGDTKLICYGGMSPASSPVNQVQNGTQHQKSAADSQPDVIVLSDIHIYDAPTRTWTYIPTANSPQGRYAHCAGVLPSAAVFTSANAPLSAIHHNPSSEHPNQGTLGVDLDGSGGAEMIVVGGQDSRNQYIEQVSVFNLRSLKWTATDTLGRSCGAYRSVIVPLTGLPASKIGKGPKPDSSAEEATRGSDRNHSGSSMLIYSNYNFLDVKLELQVRLPDGSIVEKQMNGQFNPPGLRFPNGGVIDGHFVVSGTFLTSSKQEYALWALDLKSLTWSRIDAGGNVFSQGSWNRGVLWSRRNVFVILGNRKRSLVEDYNHRRVNFSNLCMVELEAFGLYDNPRRMWPTSAYPSVSAPVYPAHNPRAARSGGRPYSKAAIELGQMASSLRELADMDLIAMGGERVPVNSHLLARRWGAYFVRLLRESASSATSNAHYQNDSASSKSEACTLRPPPSNPPAMTSRNSSITITPSGATIGSASSSNLSAGSNGTKPSVVSLDPPTVSGLSPSSRPRALYLPHTILTLRALVHYLYTSSLPSPTHHLCTPQILCSLLQIARPYRVDGLLEAVVERLHQVLDGRNAAAVFNAAAMAAGGGRGTGTIFGFEGELRFDEEQVEEGDENGISDSSTSFNSQRARGGRGTEDGGREESESDVDDDGRSEMSSSTMSSSVAGSDYLSTDGRGVVNGDEIWAGGISCVVGLQKRGLRGLMEGRRMRERGKGGGSGGGNGGAGGGGVGGASTGVGLGIA